MVSHTVHINLPAFYLHKIISSKRLLKAVENEKNDSPFCNSIFISLYNDAPVPIYRSSHDKRGIDSEITIRDSWNC
jgi:hypothetical protein